MITDITKATDGINGSAHRKDGKPWDGFKGLVVVDGKIIEAVDVRCYYTNSRVYCCVWANNSGTYASGSAWADGGGYHRQSAAMQGALQSAGVELSEDVDARGDGAMQDATEAITRALYPNAEIVQVIRVNP
jgi:hypothetical protein